MAPLDSESFQLMTDTIYRDTVIGGCAPYLAPNGQTIGVGEAYNQIQYTTQVSDSLVIVYDAEVIIFNAESTAWVDLWSCGPLYYAPLDTTFTTSTDFGLYDDEMIDESGCSTYIDYTVVINYWSAQVSAEGDHLLANEAETYQWMDCETDQIIEGADEQSFYPEEDGQYKVAATFSGCIDTTDCTSFIVNSLIERSTSSASIFPQPTTDRAYLRIAQMSDPIELHIVDALGRHVRQERLPSFTQTHILDRDGLPSGRYTVIVFSESDLLSAAWVIH